MKTLTYLLLLASFISCNNKNEDFIRISSYDKQVIDYFPKVALGFENSDLNAITRKWKTPMKVYMGGISNDGLKSELKKIISEINTLSTDGFIIEVTEDSLVSNFDILIGTAQQYYTIYPSQGDSSNTSAGNYYIYWRNKSDIFYGNMFIDINQGTYSLSTYLLRRMITGAIGLTNRNYEYSESVFFSGQRIVNAYQPIDKDMIRLLYHPDMQTGWNAEVARTKVLNILMNEK